MKAVDWTGTPRRVGDIDLHVVEAGPDDGPLVILLHGFPDCWRLWEGQIGPLVDHGFRVMIPDQRGYNLSAKPQGIAAYRLPRLVEDVIGLADAYNRERVHLIGHDWGGIVAWETAIRQPERVERLVAMAAPHPGVFFGSVVVRHPAQLLRSAYIPVFWLPRVPEVLLRARRFALLRRVVVAGSRSGSVGRGDLDRYVEAWSQPGALTAMLNWYRALPLAPRGHARVRPPTLVGWGGRDPALGRPLYEASLALCDHGEGLFLEDAGHWVQRDQTEIVNAAVTRFLRAG